MNLCMYICTPTEVEKMGNLENHRLLKWDEEQ